MKIDDRFRARYVLQGDGDPLQESLDDLIRRISALPHEARGAKALSLASRLLEIAAYELAGRVDSEEVGMLILRAAEMDEKSSDLALGGEAGQVDPARVLQ